MPHREDLIFDLKCFACFAGLSIVTIWGMSHVLLEGVPWATDKLMAWGLI